METDQRKPKTSETCTVLHFALTRLVLCRLLPMQLCTRHRVWCCADLHLPRVCWRWTRLLPPLAVLPHAEGKGENKQQKGANNQVPSTSDGNMQDYKEKTWRGREKPQLKRGFSSGILRNQTLAITAEEEGEWLFSDVDLGFTDLLFNCVLSQALAGSTQCLRMKTRGGYMGETLIYQVLAQNKFELLFCYFPSISDRVILVGCPL